MLPRRSHNVAKIVPINGKTEDSKAVEISVAVRDASKNVKKLYKEIDTAVEKIVEKAYNLGALLIKLQGEIGHGGFMKYCTDDLGLNYKKVQRYMDVAQYKTQIEQTPQIEDLQGALSLANKLKRAEKEERDEKELVMFEDFKDAEELYEEELMSAQGAKAEAAVLKPTPEWDKIQDPVERRNVKNRYKAWCKKAEAAMKAPTDELPADAKPLTIDEIVDSAYQSAMLKLDVLAGDDLESAKALLIERLSSSDFPEM